MSSDVEPQEIAVELAGPTADKTLARSSATTDSLDLIKLTALMTRSAGRREVKIGLIDGPVALDHKDLAAAHIHPISDVQSANCVSRQSAACAHGTFVAGILFARRGSPAPALCPDCTLLVRPIFAEQEVEDGEMLSATPDELADAVIECVNAGARVLNISSALLHSPARAERRLEAALAHAMRRGVLVVAAAGNQGNLGGSAITRHPWVIPVAACDRVGRPLPASNLGHSIRRGGVSAPGQDIPSLLPRGRVVTFSGTSVAAPFVTGAIALLWSAFPAARAAHVKSAILGANRRSRGGLVPPLLDAAAAYRALSMSRGLAA